MNNSRQQKLKQRLKKDLWPILKVVPRPIVEYVYFSLVEMMEGKLKHQLFGEQSRLVPPLRMMHDGPRDFRTFKQNGDEYFDIFRRLCGLKPTDHILDIGCGVGRKILPLLTFMDPIHSNYEGIDVYPPHVDWCNSAIHSAYPTYRFQHVDVWSKHYNPTGVIRASEYKLPFPDGSFDFVIMGSVFTHMFTPDMENYLREISRVLRPGGRGMISHFLLNPESEELIQKGLSAFHIVHPVDAHCKADNPDRLETAVGQDEGHVREFYDRCGISVTIHYGSWCGRDEFLSFQDILCLTK